MLEYLSSVMESIIPLAIGYHPSASYYPIQNQIITPTAISFCCSEFIQDIMHVPHQGCQSSPETKDESLICQRLQK